MAYAVCRHITATFLDDLRAETILQLRRVPPQLFDRVDDEYVDDYELVDDASSLVGAVLPSVLGSLSSSHIASSTEPSASARHVAEGVASDGWSTVLPSTLGSLSSSQIGSSTWFPMALADDRTLRRRAVVVERPPLASAQPVPPEALEAEEAPRSSHAGSSAMLDMPTAPMQFSIGDCDQETQTMLSVHPMVVIVPVWPPRASRHKQPTPVGRVVPQDGAQDEARADLHRPIGLGRQASGRRDQSPQPLRRSGAPRRGTRSSSPSCPLSGEFERPQRRSTSPPRTSLPTQSVRQPLEARTALPRGRGQAPDSLVQPFATTRPRASSYATAPRQISWFVETREGTRGCRQGYGQRSDGHPTLACADWAGAPHHVRGSDPRGPRPWPLRGVASERRAVLPVRQARIHLLAPRMIGIRCYGIYFIKSILEDRFADILVGTTCQIRKKDIAFVAVRASGPSRQRPATCVSLSSPPRATPKSSSVSVRAPVRPTAPPPPTPSDGLRLSAAPWRRGTKAAPPRPGRVGPRPSQTPSSTQRTSTIDAPPRSRSPPARQVLRLAEMVPPAPMATDSSQTFSESSGKVVFHFHL